MLTLADIIEALCEFRPSEQGSVISDAVIDSRQAIPGSLFIALPGERLDGHDFVSDAFDRGAVIALVQRVPPGDHTLLDLESVRSKKDIEISDDPVCFLVEDSLVALQEAARFWRKRQDVRVIGITGSVGKSTTKEVVAEVLNKRYRTLKNPGNLNNEIGLPLTIMRMTEGHERAVLEMGFYVPGEIEFLCEIADPHIGVVTNIGTVHAERAGSIEAIVKGKTELVEALPEDGVAILNYDDERVRQMAKQTTARVFYYGLSPEADLWADEVEGLGLEGIQFRLHYEGETVKMHIPLIGRHSVHTALRAAAVGLVEELTWQEIVEGLRSEHSQLRLVAVRTESGALLLDDTYNASPQSSLAALNMLEELEGNKIAVLGDMLELGPYEQQGHEMVGVRAAQVADRLITVGSRSQMIASAARRAGMADDLIQECKSSDDVIEMLQQTLSDVDVVLVKGSRGMQMDRIVSALETTS